MFESEEDLIVKRIKDFIKKKEPRKCYYIMLRNGRILYIDNYLKMVNDDKVNPQDAYVYILVGRFEDRSEFHYPFLIWNGDLLDACFSKLGFYFAGLAVPATGLKYIADAEVYKKYLSIEVSNLDTVVNNTNLPKIVVEVLGKKLISGEKELTADEDEKIAKMFSSQRLFAGHDFREAKNIIRDYYDRGNQSLVKEVARIAMAYVDIFQPYRVCYNMKTWKEVDCWSIKL